MPDPTRSNPSRSERAGPGWLRCLRERTTALADLPDRERRHAELMEAHEARDAAPRHVLELAYEIALEEGLDPAFALEMISCRVAVLELEAPTGASTEETHSLTAPEWVAPPELPSELAIERRIRMTFRRMRAGFEQHGDPAAAIDWFATGPDVGLYDYTPPLS